MYYDPNITQNKQNNYFGDDIRSKLHFQRGNIERIPIRPSYQQYEEYNPYYENGPIVYDYQEPSSQNGDYPRTEFVCGDIKLQQSVMQEEEEEAQDTEDLEKVPTKRAQANYQTPIGNVSTSITPGFTRHVKTKPPTPTPGFIEPEINRPYSILPDYTKPPGFTSNTPEPIHSIPGITTPGIITPGIITSENKPYEYVPTKNPSNISNLNSSIGGIGYSDAYATSVLPTPSYLLSGLGSASNVQQYANVPGFIQSNMNTIPPYSTTSSVVSQTSAPGTVNESPMYNPYMILPFKSPIQSITIKPNKPKINNIQSLKEKNKKSTKKLQPFAHIQPQTQVQPQQTQPPQTQEQQTQPPQTQEQQTQAPQIQEQQTQSPQIQAPIDSTISGWSDWSPCITGSTQRSRTQITIPPQNNGATIIPLTETDNSYCSVDCEYTGWTDWTSCQNGSSTRTRTQTFKGPFNNGRPCNPQTQTDNSYCPVDSTISGWGEWTQCITGSINRTRTEVTVPPVNNGVTIKPRTETDTTTCPIDCQFGFDKSKTTCDYDKGTMIYTVNKYSPYVNTGKKCIYQGTEITQDGQLVPSTDVCPVDCSYQQIYDSCTSDGFKNYNITYYHSALNQGNACTYNGTTITGTGKYKSTDTCPVNCTYQRTYSNCDANGKRVYQVSNYVAPINAGLDCSYTGVIIRGNDKITSTDSCVNCVFDSSFIGCVGGKRQYISKNFIAPSSGGAACLYDVSGNGQIHYKTGVSGEDCTNCTFDSEFVSCNGGQRQYVSKNYVAPVNGGSVGLYGVTANGQNHVKTGVANESCANCVGSWGAWGACSKSCGKGTQTRTYTITTNSSNGGTSCSNSHGETQSQECNTQNCPVNCVGSWGDYGACSANCGGGKKYRTYTISQPALYGGTSCSNSHGETQSQDCNTQNCPVNCVGSWGDYGACSANCGGGKKYRTYTISQPALYGGTGCSYSNGQQDSADCNTQLCPVILTKTDNTTITCSQGVTNGLSNIAYIDVPSGITVTTYKGSDVYKVVTGPVTKYKIFDLYPRCLQKTNGAYLGNPCPSGCVNCYMNYDLKYYRVTSIQY